MTRITTLALFLFTMLQLHANSFKDIDAKSFASLIKSESGVVIDVRTPQEFSRGHIEGATLISMQDKKVTAKLNLLQKDKPVYVYCLSGSRSKVVANYLSQNGFLQVFNLRRGIIEWQQVGYNLKRTAAPVKTNSKVYTSEEFGNLLKSSELVLIDFHAPWCAPCKKIAPIIESIKSEYTGKARIEKLDIDANPTIRKAYGVESIPGIILYKDGNEVWKHTGIISEQELKNILQTYIKK